MSAYPKPVVSLFSFPVALLGDVRVGFDDALNRAVSDGLCGDTVSLLESSMHSITSSKTRGRVSVGFLGREHPSTLVIANILSDVVEFSAALASPAITHNQYMRLRACINRWRDSGLFVSPKSKDAHKKNEIVIARTPSAPRKRNAFRVLIEDEAKSMVAHACNLLRLEASPVAGTDGFTQQLVLKLSWSMSRSTSRGGARNDRPWVSLALADLMDNKDIHVFTEYARIADSPEIGSCHGGWRNYLAALVAHEVAHAALDTLALSNAAKPHGLEWQKIYRYLRVSWVNTLEGYRAGADCTH